MHWLTCPLSIRLGLAGSASLSAGCGGVTQRDVTVGASAAIAPANVARGLMRIERVENRTGRAQCDDLAHYVHLKTAQLLEAQGWMVVSDELLAEADFLEITTRTMGQTEPARSIAIELVRAEEKAGATLSVAVLSSQSQTATVAVRVTMNDGRTGEAWRREGIGENTKGAWGVLAKVNRESLTRREGFWQFDHSLLGGAATAAVAKTLTFFP